MPTPIDEEGPLVRTSLADACYQRLLTTILQGSLGPGDELNESTLAKELSVSRTPIREAIRRLVADGLALDATNRKARVASFARRDFREIYQVRSALESEAAYHAAVAMDDATLADLVARAEALSGKDRSDAAWQKEAINFDLLLHEAVAAACGNRRLKLEIARYSRLIQVMRLWAGRFPEDVSLAFDEHLVILEALRSRDKENCRRAMADHVHSALAVLTKNLPTRASDEVAIG